MWRLSTVSMVHSLAGALYMDRNWMEWNGTEKAHRIKHNSINTQYAHVCVSMYTIYWTKMNDYRVFDANQRSISSHFHRIALFYSCARALNCVCVCFSEAISFFVFRFDVIFCVLLALYLIPFGRVDVNPVWCVLRENSIRIRWQNKFTLGIFSKTTVQRVAIWKRVNVNAIEKKPVYFMFVRLCTISLIARANSIISYILI